MKNSKFTKGFTLIELLVVVAIIGILAAIVYAPLQTALRKGRDAKKVAEMKSIQSSLMMFADSNGGSYPETLSQLDAATVGGIPKNYSTSTSYVPDKYNYTGYKLVDNRVVGYHLYVHLETASPALDGAAKCVGAGASATSSCLLYSGAGVTLTGVSPEPTTVNFLEAQRAGKDSDKNCAGDTNSCIFDIRG